MTLHVFNKTLSKPGIKGYDPVKYLYQKLTGTIIFGQRSIANNTGNNFSIPYSTYYWSPFSEVLIKYLGVILINT